MLITGHPLPTCVGGFRVLGAFNPGDSRQSRGQQNDFHVKFLNGYNVFLKPKFCTLVLRVNTNLLPVFMS